MNVAIEKVAGGLCYETFFNHGAGVGEVQLKNVASGFDVEAKRDRVLHGAVFGPVKLIIVFSVKGNTFVELNASARSKGNNAMGILALSNKITVNVCWCHLKGECR